MADMREITGFPILNMLRPFCCQISGVNNLRLTCILMNNVCNGPLMYIASFQSEIADQGEITGFPVLNILTPNLSTELPDLGNAYEGTMCLMAH